MSNGLYYTTIPLSAANDRVLSRYILLRLFFFSFFFSRPVDKIFTIFDNTINTILYTRVDNSGRSTTYRNGPKHSVSAASHTILYYGTQNIIVIPLFTTIITISLHRRTDRTSICSPTIIFINSYPLFRSKKKKILWRENRLKQPVKASDLYLSVYILTCYRQSDNHHRIFIL